jgi:GTP diphosphokinase / guanosine-3',5'-bis(diphosphate) 3'-diphosphatase
VISKKNLDIKNITIINRSENYFELLIDIEVKNTNHLEEIISALLISNRISEAKRAIN